MFPLYKPLCLWHFVTAALGNQCTRDVFTNTQVTGSTSVLTNVGIPGHERACGFQKEANLGRERAGPPAGNPQVRGSIGTQNSPLR